MSLLIKNGRIIMHNNDFTADIFIDQGKIKTIFERITSPANQTVNAQGKYVIPGGIDVHTHLDMPLGDTTSSDDFRSGTIAAAFGGTTSIIDFPTQQRGKSIEEALDIWFAKAESRACIDYGFHMIITDLSLVDKTSLQKLVKQGITSFKLFMAYPNTLMLTDADLYQVMEYTRELGALVTLHAENGPVIDQLIHQALRAGKKAPIYHALTRPAVLEGEAVNRAVSLAQLAGCPLYIVHLSTIDGLEVVKRARQQGLPVYAETCPQYLVLSLQNMIDLEQTEGAKYVFTPPLREKEHQKKLWQGIADGIIQVVATDHCPFNFQGQKINSYDSFTEIPNGLPGIENRLALIYEEGVIRERITLNRWVDLCSTAPAKLFGLYPQKGTIREGSDADLVIWDPDREQTISATDHHMNVDYNPYENRKSSGSVHTVVSRGEVIIDNGTFTGHGGRGKYLKRSLFSSDLVLSDQPLYR